jgi:hypothetical protein
MRKDAKDIIVISKELINGRDFARSYSSNPTR